MPDQLAEKNMTVSNSDTTTIHGTVKAVVNGQEARIMIDTGASSSYVCSDLVTSLALKPLCQETRCVEQMHGTVTRKVEIYSITIALTAVERFSFDVRCINAEKPILTYLPNPKIKQLKKRYPRLRRLQISDDGSNERQLPVHIILGAGDYQRIRSTEQPIVGKNPDTDPGVEFTMLGWMILGKQIIESSNVEKGFSVQ